MHDSFVNFGSAVYCLYVGQSEVYENGSSADNYGDMYGIQNQSKELLAEYGGRPIVHQDKEYGLWGNSSR